jgi:hypothetical protein
MIQIKQLRTVPETLVLEMTLYGKKDFAITSQMEVVGSTKRQKLWLLSMSDKPLVLLGMRRGTLLGSSELWIIACKSLASHKIELVKFFRRGRPHIVRALRSVHVYVDEKFEMANKLARLIGFTPCGYLDGDDGVRYLRYEAR